MARKRSPGLEWQKKWIEAREYCKNKALEKSWGKALDIWLAIYTKQQNYTKVATFSKTHRCRPSSSSHSFGSRRHSSSPAARVRHWPSRSSQPFSLFNFRLFVFLYKYYSPFFQIKLRLSTPSEGFHCLGIPYRVWR